MTPPTTTPLQASVTVTDADTPHFAELPDAVATGQHHADSESQSDAALFEMNEEAAVHMEALLRAAEQHAMMGTENTRRLTRSPGVEFRWNPKLNDKDGPLWLCRSFRALQYYELTFICF